MSEKTTYACDGCGKPVERDDIAYGLNRLTGDWEKFGPREVLREMHNRPSFALRHACSKECAVKIADAMRAQLDKL